MPDIPLVRHKSSKIYQKACDLIPAGVSSPVRAFGGLNQTPLIVESGCKEKVVDVDGFSYIDFCCSWGALIHGHAHPSIIKASRNRMDQGSSFGITTAIEGQLAQKIREHMPSLEKIRFVSSGTEATMSAARLARGFTGRDLLVKFAGHYHGHADSFLVEAGSGVVNVGPTASSAGVCQDVVKNTLVLPFNDFEGCYQLFKEHGKKIAAVILEPIAANMGVVFPVSGFLQMLREETLKMGALLIFDEVITGFRVALRGAGALYDVKPDLTCLGKVIGGGFPAAAFGGRADVMDYLAPKGPVYQAGTLSGNPVAMEAGFQTISLCEKKGFYQMLEEKTASIVNPVRQLIEEKELNVCIHQSGSLFTLFFGRRKVENLEDVKACDIGQFNRFFQALFQKGIYLSPSQFEANFVSSAHSTESLHYTRDSILAFL